MDNKNEDKRKLRYNKNTHELDLIDMEDDNTTRLSFFEKVKVILIRNEIIYKTIFTLFGTMMTIALTYAGVKVASMANTIAKEQVNMQSREVEIALNERMPFFEITSVIGTPNYVTDFLEEYALGLDDTGKINFDFDAIINDLDYTFFDNFNSESMIFVPDSNYNPSVEVPGLPGHLELMLRASGTYVVDSIEKRKLSDLEIQSHIKDLLNLAVQNENYSKLTISNKGGIISNTIIYPYEVLEISLDNDFKNTYFVYLNGYFGIYNNLHFNLIENHSPDGVSISLKHSYYERLMEKEIKNILTKEYPKIAVDSTLYLNIQFTDFAKENHNEWYGIEDWTLIQITEDNIIKKLESMDGVFIKSYNTTDDIQGLKQQILGSGIILQ